MPAIDIAVLDLGGTTVRIGDVVEQAVRQVTGDQFDSVEFTAMRGASKLDLMTRLVGPASAPAAHAGFEEMIQSAVVSGEITPMPGASEAIEEIRSRGTRVCLLTGFSESIHRSMLERFGWVESVDLALSPSQELRGRPWPDLILTAAARLHTSGMDAVAVVGDTTNDVEAARRAGAGICAAVLTGAHRRSTLAGANPTHILSDLAEFVEIITPPAD
ncbi:MAG: HAD family hydrolase [Actinomycetota bacterium]|nr:HAD family hydrolase [Actinomycetota bacterium]